MPLVTTRELFQNAQKEGYAIGAFNVENMEMVQAVILAAEELHSPVIMQTTPSTLKYAGPDYFYGNIAAAAKNAGIISLKRHTASSSVLAEFRSTSGIPFLIMALPIRRISER